MSDPTEFAEFSQWLTWLEARNPARIELGLSRVQCVWQELLASHSLSVPLVVTVAGTNGKGSSCALLDAILQAADYRVGRYTSPHLVHFNERILINGLSANDEVLLQGMRAIHSCSGSNRLTYFEWATLLAFLVFAQAQCDVWVLEVGMGGRLDAVNVLSADLALITAIGLDHQAFLGETREAIGQEKAGILRTNQIAVYADPQPVSSILVAAESLGCPLLVRQRDYSVAIEAGRGWQLSLFGDTQRWPNPALFGAQQIDNAAGVIALLNAGQAKLPVPPEAMRQGLSRVRLPGRFEQQEYAGRRIIWDVAHNEDSARALINNLHDLKVKSAPKGKLRAVFSALSDKPIAAMMTICADAFDAWYLAPLDGPRAASQSQLQQAAVALRTNDIHYESTIASAYNRAFIESTVGDWLVVFGSFHTVGALRTLASEQR